MLRLAAGNLMTESSAEASLRDWCWYQAGVDTKSALAV